LDTQAFIYFGVERNLHETSTLDMHEGITNNTYLYRHTSVIVDGALLGIVSLVSFFIVLGRKLRKSAIDN